MEKSNFKRSSVRFNFDTKISEKGNVGANIYTEKTKADEQKLWPGARNSSVMYKLLTANPGRPAYNPDGSLGQITFSRDNTPWINPIGQMTVPDRDASSYRTYVNLWADYEIAKGLVAKLNLGYDHTARTTASYVPGIYTGEYVPDSQQGEIRELKLKNSLIEGTLSYDTNFKNHTIKLLGGASTQYYDTFGFSAKGVGFPTDKTSYYNLGSSSQGQSISSFREDSRLISAFARANYNFNDKYFVTGTIRADGDSKFGSNGKWGWFPSASLAWRISEENFVKDSKVLNELKLRFGYGVTGNNSFGPYTALARVAPTGPYSFDGDMVITGLGAADSYAPNPDLQWETSHMLNLGVDFGLWDNRVSGSVELYNTDTKNLIIDKSISKPSTGYNLIRSNIGEINNKGIELTLAGDIIDNDFKWSISANAAKNVNEVVELDGDNNISIRVDKEPGGRNRAVFTEIAPGEPVGNFIGYVYEGVLQEGQTYAPQPATTRAGSALYKDIDGDGLITIDDRVILGNSAPDFTYGFNNRFSYKGFSLDLFFQGVQGNDILNLRKVMIDEFNTPNSLSRYNSTSNPSGNLPGSGYFYEGSYGSYVNDLFVEDGSYLRLKNVVLAYKFDVGKVNWLNSIEIYVTGQNLITWTNYSGFDPEVSFYSGNGISRGVDDNGYPSSRNYSGGLRFTIN